MKQTTLGLENCALKAEVARQAHVLTEMHAVAPRARLRAVVESQYPKGRSGSPTEPAPANAAIALRRESTDDLAVDLAPDEASIRGFRHLLQKHRVVDGLFAEVRKLLEEENLVARLGTIRGCDDHRSAVDHKRAKERNPELKQTRKSKQRHFEIDGTSKRTGAAWFTVWWPAGLPGATSRD